MNIPHRIWLIDECTNRRGHIVYSLSRLGLHVEPFESAAEFVDFRPDGGVVLINDDERLLESFQIETSRSGCAYRYIVFAEVPNWRRVVDVLRSGASSYLAWPADMQEVAESVAAIEPDSRVDIAGSIHKERARELSALFTHRELQVFIGVAEGLTSKEIAERLGISFRTVEVHRANLRKKTNTKNGAELAFVGSGILSYLDREDSGAIMSAN